MAAADAALYEGEAVRSQAGGVVVGFPGAAVRPARSAGILRPKPQLTRLSDRGAQYFRCTERRRGRYQGLLLSSLYRANLQRGS